MIKRTASRNHRSKGIKVKHVLQIILLLGVCFWLIYQVKRSHDKKKEFDDTKLSVRDHTPDLIPKLGRKDLHPGKDEVNQKEKREEEEEDENIIEDEENKHDHDELREDAEDEGHKQDVRDQGEEEQEEDENKSEETEDEGRGGGDDEIDENDQEKPDMDIDRDEELVDEVKDTETEGVDEKENENIEDEDNEGLVENRNTHEAREEHYKGDDASSAVAHDTRTTSTLTETYILAKSDENSENKTSNSGESNRNHNDSKVIGDELKDWTSLNATASKETRNNSLSNQVDNSPPNDTATTNTDSHLEASGNLTIATVEASNNLVGTGANTSSLSEQINKMVIFLESDNAQNATVNTTVTGEVQTVETEGVKQSGHRVSEVNLPDSGATNSVKSENLEKTVTSAAASNETENNPRNLEGRESIDASEHDKSNNTETSKTSETQNSSDMKENTDASEDEKSNGETDETSSDTSSDNVTLNSVEQADIDSTDSHILQDVTEVRTDLDTLPDIRNGGDNGDETAAE